MGALGEAADDGRRDERDGEVEHELDGMGFTTSETVGVEKRVMFVVEVLEHELDVEQTMCPVEQRIFEDVEESELEQELSESGEVVDRAGEASGGQQGVADQTHRENHHQVSNQAPVEHSPHRLLVRGHSSKDLVLRAEIVLFDDQIGQVANQPDQLVCNEHSSHEDGRIREIVRHWSPQGLYQSGHDGGTRVKQRLSAEGLEESEDGPKIRRRADEPTIATLNCSTLGQRQPIC